MSNCKVINITTRKVQAFVSIDNGTAAIVLSVTNPFGCTVGINLSPAQAREIADELIRRADELYME